MLNAHCHVGRLAPDIPVGGITALHVMWNTSLPTHIVVYTANEFGKQVVGAIYREAGIT